MSDGDDGVEDLRAAENPGQPEASEENGLGALRSESLVLLLSCKVPEPETVACHMYRMAVLAMSLHGQVADLDTQRWAVSPGEERRLRCVRMALVHDIGEALVGDITPHCGVSEEDKFHRELEAVRQISELAPGVDWLELWHEYETALSLEAQVRPRLLLLAGGETSR